MMLSQKTVASLEGSIASVPTYDRSCLVLRQVHIGLGHFHRAHYLTYLDTLLNQGSERDWGVFEVDIPPAREEFIANLQKQDYLYSVLSWGSDGSSQIRVNGPIIGYANASQEPQTVLDKLSDPSVRMPHHHLQLLFLL